MKRITHILVFAFISQLCLSQTVYRLDHTHSYTWDNEDWLRIVEVYYDYDNGGLEETAILNKVSSDGITFIDSFRHNKTYDSNNSLLTDIKQLWNGVNWLNSTKRENTYNQADQTEVSSFYDQFIANDWVLHSHSTVTTTANGYNTENWVRNNTGTLEPDTKTITFISNNQLIREIEQFWNASTSDWENDEKVEVSYTSEDQWDVFEYFYWDPTLSPANWEALPYSRTSYIRTDPTYDLIILIEMNEAGNWINESRILYTRNANNNLLSTTTQVWDADLGPSGEWTTFSTTSWTYDNNDNYIQTISQSDYTGEGLENSIRRDYFWEEATDLSVSFNSINNISTYPNPTTDVINVNFKVPTSNISEAQLYNVQGKLIYSLKIQQGINLVQIPIKYQQNGIYLLKIKTKESVQTYKIVKGQ